MTKLSNYLFTDTKLKKNIFSYSVNFFFNLVIQILFPPLMMLYWGSELFGLIIFLLTIPASLSFLILNFNTASRQEMLSARVKNNYNIINKIYSNTLILVSICYLLYFIFSILIINYFNFNIEGDFLSSNELKMILILLFSSYLIKFFEAIFALKISYFGKYYIPRNLDTLFELIIKLSMILIGFLKINLIFIFYTFFLIHIIKIFIYYLFSKIDIKINFKVIYLDTKYISDLFKKSIQYFFVYFEEIIKTSIFPFLIGLFFNMNLVAFYSTLRTMFYFFPKRFFEIISEVLQFNFAKLFYEKKIDLLKRIYTFQMILTLVLSSCFLIFSYFFGEIIYLFWINNKFMFDGYMMSLIVLDCFLICLSNSLISFFKSINKFQFFSFSSFVLYLIVSITCYFLFQNGHSFEIIVEASFIGSLIVFILSLLYMFKLKKI